MFLSLILLSGCSHPLSDPATVVFVIASNPANLDPRFGSDAQSQRLSALLFDGLVERDAEMNLHPDLAESWDTPTPSPTSSISAKASTSTMAAPSPPPTSSPPSISCTTPPTALPSAALSA